MNKQIIGSLLVLLVLSIGINIYFINSGNSEVIINSGDNNEGVQGEVVVADNKEIVEKNNIEAILDIKTNDDIIKYKGSSNFSEALLFYSIKYKEEFLWSGYWGDVYDKINNPNFSKEDFSEKIGESFNKIKDNELALNEYKDFILDGSIFFSSASIDDKTNACKTFHVGEGECDDCDEYDIENGTNSNERLENCVNLSYFYEAITKNDVKYCDSIVDNDKGIDLKENCDLLVELVK